MGKRFFAALALMFLVLRAGPSRADDIGSLSIRAIDVAQDGTVKLFLAFIDPNLQPTTRIDFSKLTLERDGKVLKPSKSPTTFVASGEGTAVILAIDTSGSMRNAMPRLKESLQTFTSRLRAGSDKAALGSIGDDWKMELDFTGDKDLVGRTLNRMEANTRTTALFESIYQGVDVLMRRGSVLPKRKYMVVVSDGLNEKMGRTADECIQLAKKGMVQVHSLIFLERPTERFLREKGVLERISVDTGGMTRTLNSTEQIPSAVDRLQREISEELVWSLSDSPPVDGKEHELVIRYDRLSATLSYRAPLVVLPIKVDADSASESGTASTSEDKKPKGHIWVLLAIVLAGLLLVGGAIFLMLRARDRAHRKVERMEQQYQEELQKKDAMLHKAAEEKELAVAAAKRSEKTAPPEPKAQPKPSSRKTEYRPPETIAGAVKDLRAVKGIEDFTLMRIPDAGGTIGYDLGNEIVINDDSISGRHARIVPLPDQLGFGISDLGSTNGTYVDGEKVGARVVPLRLGSQVRLGVVVLVCE